MATSVNTKRPHVPEEELHAYCDGELSPPQRVEIAEHLLGCLICRSQHAEVEEVRTRTSTLLAMAAPRVIRGMPLPQMAPVRAGRRLPRLMATAAIAVLSAGMWFSLQPDRVTGSNRLAGSFATPGLTVAHDSSTTAADLRSHQAALGARAVSEPQLVIDHSDVTPAAPARKAIMGTDVDPVVGGDWAQSSWETASRANGGAIVRIAGLAVSSVRRHPSPNGGRPTYMIRQQLADGRAVWVLEGPEGDVAPFNQLLEASGIAMSMALRSRPDYVTQDGQVSRTRRMITVVGHLPVDSLNTLMGKVRE